jgi:hypothetical protein
MKRLPEEATEEFSKRRDKYFFPLIQVTSMVVACQVQLENCDKALQDQYGHNWKEEWGQVFDSLKNIQLKLETFHNQLECGH